MINLWNGCGNSGWKEIAHAKENLCTNMYTEKNVWNFHHMVEQDNKLQKVGFGVDTGRRIEATRKILSNTKLFGGK